jgi:peptidoglycan/LPS O-acetylase OafA/YrhL
MMAFGGLVVYQYGIFHGETNPSRSYLREFGLYFIAGSVLYLFHESWKGREILIVSACALTGIAVYLLGEHALGVLILLAPLTIFTGDASTPVLRRFGRYGDLSYGVYIYAFVIQQTLIWCFSANASFILLLLAVLCITLACAWLSWHFVEKPALSLKSLLVSRMAGTLDRGVPREVNEP